jgi:hypothetical protein
MMKQNNWIEKGVWGLLIVLNALFLYYWVVLAANYRMHFDDVHFMWQLRDKSIIEYVHEMYLTKGGNYVGYTLNGIIFTISNWVGDYHFWPIVFYVLGIVITWGAFRGMPWIKNSGWKGWLAIITLYNVYVLTSVDCAVFTWLCAMQYYLFGPILCLMLKLLSKKTLAWWQWLVLIFIAIFISGNAVSISTITFVVLVAYGMYMCNKQSWRIRATWAQPQVRRLVGITLLMIISFAIVFVAPSNWERMDTEFDIEQPQTLMQFIKAIAICGGMFVYMMAFYLPYHLIAVSLGAWAGIKYPMELPVSRKKAMILTVVIAIAYLIVSVTPLAYLSNGFQIQRNYIQIGFFYILTFFALGYLLTNQPKVDGAKMRKWINLSMSVCTMFLIVIMALNIRQDLPVARAYSKAHQEREEYLLKLQETGNTETIVVAHYPSTQMPDAKYNVLKSMGKKTNMQAIYYESDTDLEPNEYESHIRNYLKLDFDFVLAEPKE